MNNHVPFLDLITPHVEREDEFVAVLREALKTGRFIGGPMVEDFEKEFAQFCGSKYCIGVGNGTDALRFALHAAGVKKDDIVLTVPNTFIATTEAISQVGALSEFVDIDERTYNMSAARLQEYLQTQCSRDDKTGRPVHRGTKRPVSAIVPVHLYGQMADMDALLELAEKYNVVVIEDACQAHGARYFSQKEKRWRTAGSMGRASAFSFYPGKNLGACGEAGAVTTDDEDLARTVRMLRDHGQVKKYYHEIEGYNGRLDAIQAGFLRIKLKDLPAWNEQRRQHAFRYNELLRPIAGVMTPYEPEWSKAVYHLYVIRTGERDALQAHLAGKNISAALHYPIPLHFQQAYANLRCRTGDLPVSEKLAREILSLPMYPGLTDMQQAYVAECIRDFLAKTPSMDVMIEVVHQS